MAKRNTVIFDSTDTGPLGRAGIQPRAQGRLHLACKARGPRTDLASLYQKGSLKALFPRAQGDHMDMVLLNTAGGITGGDDFEYTLEVAENAALRVSSQAAERVYKAQAGEVGKVCVSARVGDGASLLWVPQETIVFDEANLSRTFTVDMAETSHCLCVEPMVFGRQAMGEAVNRAKISDQWRIRRDGKLVYADAMRIEGNVHDILSRPAVGNGCIAMAAMVLVSAQAEAKLEPLRRAIGDAGGASLVRDGVLTARILATDSFTLRKALIPAIETLSDMTIPKTWRL